MSKALRTHAVRGASWSGYFSRAHTGLAAVAISGVHAQELSHAWRIAAALREGLGSDYVAIHVRCGGSRYTVDPKTTVAAVPYDDGYATKIPDAVLAELRALRETCVMWTAAGQLSGYQCLLAF
jgi:hypothetical protein